MFRIQGHLADSNYSAVINISSHYANDVFAALKNSIFITTIHSVLPYEVDTMVCSDSPPRIIVVVSYSVKEFILRRHPFIREFKKIEVVTPMVSQEIRSLRIPRPKKQNHIKLIYVGRIEIFQKRVDRLCLIADRLQAAQVDFSLTIVGEGSFLAKLKTLVYQSPFRNRVFFKGFLNHQDVLQEIALSDVLILCSDTEGSPHVVIEAMSQCCVPIASKIEGSTSEMVSHGHNGFLVDQACPDSFCAFIEQLSINEEELNLMKVHAHKTFASRYSTDAVGATWIELISQQICCSDVTSGWPKRRSRFSDGRIGNFVSSVYKKIIGLLATRC